MPWWGWLIIAVILAGLVLAAKYDLKDLRRQRKEQAEREAEQAQLIAIMTSVGMNPIERCKWESFHLYQARLEAQCRGWIQRVNWQREKDKQKNEEA